MNTIFIVVVGTSINLIMTLIAAYVLSRKKFMMQNVMMMLIVFSMYFNGGMIPSYLVVKGVGLNNSIWALIIPAAINTYNLIIMRTAMTAVPASLEESALLDGANPWTILWRSWFRGEATIAVICHVQPVAHLENSWFSAMLYIRDRGHYPLN